MLEKIVIEWKEPWKTIVILWCIHWNEVCWKIAIGKILGEIATNNIQIKKWNLIFVPVCNPMANEKNTRYIDINLNRNIIRHDDLWPYENSIANEICDVLDEADYLLDLHSSHESDCAYMTQDGPDDESRARADALWLKYIITWRQDIYSWADSKDTNAYVIRKWWSALTVECWQHNDPNAIQVAYACIVKSLLHFWFVDTAPYSLWGESQRINFTQIIRKEKEWEMIKKWKDFDRFEKWDVVATYDDWTVLSCDEPWYIVFPRHDCPIWDERYYRAT